MSTRALYTFRSGDGSEEHHVYVHSDGYPTGAADKIVSALEYAWPLPRYEADEFAAAFVAANKAYYINEELDLLREVEASLNGTSKRPLIDVQKDLINCRRYGAQGFNGGGVRLMPSGDWTEVAPQDIEYRYLIQPRGGVGAGTQMNAQLLVQAFKVSHQGQYEYVEGKPTRDGHRTFRERKVPKSRQGWSGERLFTAPLKSGKTLKDKAAAWEAKDRAAAA